MCETNVQIILDKFGEPLKCPIITKLNVSTTNRMLNERQGREEIKDLRGIQKEVWRGRERIT